MRLARIAGMVSLLLLFANQHGVADTQSTPDPDDTDIALEIVQATHGHYRDSGGRRYLAHTVTAAEPWANETLENHSLVFFFSLDRDAPSERGLFFETNPDGSLSAVMTGEGKTRGFARVWRPDDRTVKAVFPMHYLGRNLDIYRWRIIAKEHGVHCDGGACMEIVPNERMWIKHRL